VRTIAHALAEFARIHPDRGYPQSLAALGPAPGDDLIDMVLASSKKSGYVFALTPVAPDSQRECFITRLRPGHNITATIANTVSLQMSPASLGSRAKIAWQLPRILSCK